MPGRQDIDVLLPLLAVVNKNDDALSESLRGLSASLVAVGGDDPCLASRLDAVMGCVRLLRSRYSFLRSTLMDIIDGALVRAVPDELSVVLAAPEP